MQDYIFLKELCISILIYINWYKYLKVEKFIFISLTFNFSFWSTFFQISFCLFLYTFTSSNLCCLAVKPIFKDFLLCISISKKSLKNSFLTYMWDLLYWLFFYIVKYIWLVKRDEMNNILKLFLVMIFYFLFFKRVLNLLLITHDNGWYTSFIPIYNFYLVP